MASSPAAATARAALVAAVAGSPGAVELLARWDRWSEDLVDGLADIYDVGSTLPRIAQVIAEAHLSRPAELIARDRARVLHRDWFQEPGTVGYVAYTDRFAGTLEGIEGHVDYLRELGVTYLHLMPLLQPRLGPNDGGYAVADYRSVRSDLGTMDDLRHLANTLHDNDISLKLDLVLNHVAQEHEWALAAVAGDAKYRDYFLTFPDRTVPDEYEQTLPEVFPAFAPGNFTWNDEMSAWVWTTFNSWQWDLNWANPDVFVEFADIILFLANAGVDCLRFDAIAFTWKRVGTNCQNQPEVHSLTQALRTVARIATPTTIFTAEAIVAPDDLVPYLGQGKHAGKVSDLAYHNSLMVQIWSALATRDGRLMAQALSRFAAIPTTAGWSTYLRCHDDIGWAIDDDDAAAVGWNGYDHRTFLASFFAGTHPGSFSRGMHFQSNPATGDRRTSGSAASLTGIEAALESGDEAALSTAIDRLMCSYAMVIGFGGIPLIYMGDELAMLNDYTFVDVPEHAEDNRWLHRPMMDWELAEQRHDPSTVAGRVFPRMQALIAARKELDSLHASVSTVVETADAQSVVLFTRRHAAGNIVEVYNLSEEPTTLWVSHLTSRGITAPFDHISGTEVEVHGGAIILPPYAALWLT